ncbi:hypothetical protein BDQ12DRAFT_652263 [Crucibulum laeve]|uniref:S5 DRBM domain-containing protein n=1 Tax=Crucibulum laeve TaxID=68775 RepID=A0A5C3MA52_9AGAR|nr:hypothetical protein BDQ12DRAFT_652263 [Crucibulum laeve]
MNRLLFRPVARAIRVQKPSISQQCVRRSLHASAIRRNGSKESPADILNVLKKDSKFDLLFNTLRPGMNQDELAVTIAMLLVTTRSNTANMERLESVLPQYLMGRDLSQVQEMVETYVKNPMHLQGVQSAEDVDSIQAEVRKLIRSREELAELAAATRAREAAQRPEETGAGQRSVVETTGEALSEEEIETSRSYTPYPDLMTADDLLDPRDVLELPPTKDSPYHNRVIIRNHVSVFDTPKAVSEGMEDDNAPEDTESDQRNEWVKRLPVDNAYYTGLYHSILMRRRVIQQTGKGKIGRISYTVLLGDGNGLIGLGEGKHENSQVALNAARLDALKNMDYVERFEKRTVWTEMETKLGATKLILRPRPVGFGLRCNPYLHQILRAAGFKDVSAKVWGSRNKLNVIKAAFRLLQAGHEPTGMGDGIGGPGRTQHKGSGMKGKDEVERARGRKLISLRK